jgi:hypothetical protein
MKLNQEAHLARNRSLHILHFQHQQVQVLITALLLATILLPRHQNHFIVDMIIARNQASHGSNLLQHKQRLIVDSPDKESQIM